MEIYQPLWDYDAKTIYKDVSAHLAFGLATGAAFRLLAATADVPDDATGDVSDGAPGSLA